VSRHFAPPAGGGFASPYIAGSDRVDFS